jgi:hypothetical protein
MVLDSNPLSFCQPAFNPLSTGIAFSVVFFFVLGCYYLFIGSYFKWISMKSGESGLSGLFPTHTKKKKVFGELPHFLFFIDGAKKEPAPAFPLSHNRHPLYP